jgi:hypothetical protein
MDALIAVFRRKAIMAFGDQGGDSSNDAMLRIGWRKAHPTCER